MCEAVKRCGTSDVMNAAQTRKKYKNVARKSIRIKGVPHNVIARGSVSLRLRLVAIHFSFLANP